MGVLNFALNCTKRIDNKCLYSLIKRSGLAMTRIKRSFTHIRYIPEEVKTLHTRRGEEETDVTERERESKRERGSERGGGGGIATKSLPREPSS